MSRLFIIIDCHRHTAYLLALNEHGDDVDLGLSGIMRELNMKDRDGWKNNGNSNRISCNG